MLLDSIDRKILSLLQREGRIRHTELAERVGLSPTPCARRVARLEEQGIITGYAARVNQEALGLPINAFVSVELENQSADTLACFEREVNTFDEVMECYLMTGSQDYLMHVVAADLHAYERFVQNKLSTVPHIRSIRTRFALRRMVARKTLPNV